MSDENQTPEEFEEEMYQEFYNDTETPMEEKLRIMKKAKALASFAVVVSHPVFIFIWCNLPGFITTIVFFLINPPKTAAYLSLGIMAVNFLMYRFLFRKFVKKGERIHEQMKKMKEVSKKILEKESGKNDGK